MVDNWSGLYLLESTNNNISRNSLSYNRWGIYLNSSSKNNFTKNNIRANNDGIYLKSSYDNMICHNSFLYNNEPAFDDTNYGNQWDNGYPSGGNFWLDYDYVDHFNGPYQNISGSDGIGDAAYKIDLNSQDNYPLMEPYLPLTPDAPRNLQATPHESYIHINWSAPSFNGGSPITGYIIYRGTSSGDVALYKEMRNTSFYDDTNVIKGVTYYYRVSAVNLAGEGGLTNKVGTELIQPSVPKNELPWWLWIITAIIIIFVLVGLVVNYKREMVKKKKSSM